MLHLPSHVSNHHGELRTKQCRSDLLDQRVSAALIKERQLGGRLGAHALASAFSAIAVWCALVHPWPGAAFYLGLVAAFLCLAWLWGQLARRPLASWLILSFVLANAALLTVTLLVPNPIDPQPWPIQMKLRPPAFPFFLMLVAWSTSTLSPSLVLGSGLIVTGTWSFGVGTLALLPDTVLGFGLPDAHPDALARYLDPRFIDSAAWASSIFTAVLISGILAVVVARTRYLVKAQARIQRARDNLARHVSANLVQHLSEVDEPFGPVRTEHVAVLFVDIVGFTALCDRQAPEAVMSMLRRFHEEMADCVFKHEGTLDKFVGDGVMATFGTPWPCAEDAANALACARSMLRWLETWDTERSAKGERSVRVGIGLHFGPVVLGEIGNEQRLEFAVIGDTVNTASRLEALTRPLGTSLIASNDLIARVREQSGNSLMNDMRRHAPLVVPGMTRPIEVWTLARRPSIERVLPPTDHLNSDGCPALPPPSST